ncbi:hypothetical protein AB0I46_46070 [Streptomyces spectabilis]
MDAAFALHPHYPIYRSFPACGPVIAARFFSELGVASTLLNNVRAS